MLSVELSFCCSSTTYTAGEELVCLKAESSAAGHAEHSEGAETTLVTFSKFLQGKTPQLHPSADQSPQLHPSADLPENLGYEIAAFPSFLGPDIVTSISQAETNLLQI